MTPQFVYRGAEQYEINQRDRWLEVEAEFTEELTPKYFILFNERLLTGEVTHVHVPAGRENRSVMYVAPHNLARLSGNRPMTAGSVQNIAVQIVQQGLNKNETPFAPLFWDRYEQIKPGR